MSDPEHPRSHPQSGTGSSAQTLQGIEGLVIPATIRFSRAALQEIAAGRGSSRDILGDGGFPIIIRPLGSHAGFGTARIDDPGALGDYLRQRPEGDFFVSRYVDYAGKDGLFRKYRVALIGGKPYACHMAIADEWKVWYLNADMAMNVSHRLEEAAFMQYFDDTFAARHQQALCRDGRPGSVWIMLLSIAPRRERASF